MFLKCQSGSTWIFHHSTLRNREEVFASHFSKEETSTHLTKLLHRPRARTWTQLFWHLNQGRSPSLSSKRGFKHAGGWGWQLATGRGEELWRNTSQNLWNKRASSFYIKTRGKMWQLDEFHFETHLTRKVKMKLQGYKPTTIKIKTSFHKPIAKLNIDFFFSDGPHSPSNSWLLRTISNIILKKNVSQKINSFAGEGGWGWACTCDGGAFLWLSSPCKTIKLFLNTICGHLPW